MAHFTRTLLRDNRVFVLSFALAAIIYLVMILGPLARLEAIAGMAPFDMRPGGYSLAEAQALVAAFGAKGRRIYLFNQIPLDMLYPGLLGLTMFIALSRVAAGLDGMLGMVIYALRWTAVPVALADYAENLMIIIMLASGHPLDGGTVALASASSMAKAGFTTLAASTLLFGGALLAVRRLRARFG